MNLTCHFPRPIGYYLKRLGWENKQSLLRKYVCYGQHLLQSALTVFTAITSAGLTGPPLWLLNYAVEITVRMTRFSLPITFISSHFRVVFNFRPSHFLKGKYLLLDHTRIFRNIFYNGVTDWRFTIVIKSRIDILFIHICTCLPVCNGNHKTYAREFWYTDLRREILRNSHAVCRTDYM